MWIFQCCARRGERHRRRLVGRIRTDCRMQPGFALLQHTRQPRITFGRATVPLPPAAFLQAAPAAEAAMVSRAVEAVRGAKKVADRVIFFDEGSILEDTTPQAFFTNPDHERAQAFLAQVRHGF